MISHKHKCIFVHVPKAAGTSLEQVFIEDLGLDMNNRHSLLLGLNTNQSLGPRRVSHLLASEYVEHSYISQELFNSYFKFSFVRNPYSRLFSTYKFLKFSDYLSFDNFISKKLPKLFKDPKFHFFLKPAYDYLYDTNGLCLVDYVGKFENLSEDYEFMKRNITFLNTDAQLKHYNKTGNTNTNINKIRRFIKILGEGKMHFDNTNNTLSTSSKDKILEIYSNDFKTFEYSK